MAHEDKCLCAYCDEDIIAPLREAVEQNIRASKALKRSAEKPHKTEPRPQAGAQPDSAALKRHAVK